MKTLSLSLTVVCLCVALNFSVPAQQRGNQAQSRQKSSQPEIAVLDRFNDCWAKDIDVMIFPSISSAGVKGIVTRPNKHTASIKFTSLNMPMYDKVITLKYDLAVKKYLLTVKSTSGLSLEDFPLSFSEEDGFTGEGRTSDDNWAVRVSIKKEGVNKHHWEIEFKGASPIAIRKYLFTLEPKGSAN